MEGGAAGLKPEQIWKEKEVRMDLGRAEGRVRREQEAKKSLLRMMKWLSNC